MAAYNSKGPATILRLDLNHFGAFKEILKVNDHVGAVLSDANLIFLMNWDSKRIYQYDQSKKLATSSTAGTGWQYQDCKHVARGYAICSALKGHFFSDGAIQLLHFSSTTPFAIKIVHEVKIDNFYNDGSRGGRRLLTTNAVDFAPILDAASKRIIGIRFYFVVHDDDESTLMIFDSSV